MKYVDIKEAIAADGLRIVIVKGTPSAWGIAAKGMIQFKQLDFVAAYQIPMADNPELLAWSGTNSAPVVAWNDEPPVNRWNDILFLLERLAPDKRLVPEDPAERIRVMGLSHEICGELGFGWNRRFSLIRPPGGGEASAFALKYGYTPADDAAADARVAAFMRELTSIFEAQKQRGSRYLVGSSVTAADFYWAAFSNFVALQPAEEMPVHPAARPMFERVPDVIRAALDPILIEHRNYVMHTYFELPVQL